MELPETTKDITVDWLNEVLHENGFLGSANIVSLNHEQIGVGAGFASDISKLTLAFDRESANLPKTVIAKLPPQQEPQRSNVIRNKVFEREIRFYREVAQLSPIRTPRLIYGGMDPDKQRFVILMEDCSRYTPTDPELQGLTYEQIKIVISKIAGFHARWWGEKNSLCFPWMPKFKDSMLASINTFRTNWDACAQLEDFNKALPKGGFEAGMKIREKLPLLVKNMPEDKLTTIHGDLKSDNMFFDWDTPTDPLIVFDWAGTTNIARAPTDIAYLLGSSLAPELRRKTEKDLVRLFYGYLLAGGVSNYSFDECQTDYLKGLILRSGGLLAIYLRADRNEPRSAKLLNVMLQRRFSIIVDNHATSILPDK